MCLIAMKHTPLGGHPHPVEALSIKPFIMINHYEPVQTYTETEMVAFGIYLANAIRTLPRTAHHMQPALVIRSQSGADFPFCWSRPETFSGFREGPYVHLLVQACTSWNAPAGWKAGTAWPAFNTMASSSVLLLPPPSTTLLPPNLRPIAAAAVPPLMARP